MSVFTSGETELVITGSSDRRGTVLGSFTSLSGVTRSAFPPNRHETYIQWVPLTEWEPAHGFLLSVGMHRDTVTVSTLRPCEEGSSYEGVCTCPDHGPGMGLLSRGPLVSMAGPLQKEVPPPLACHRKVQLRHLIYSEKGRTSCVRCYFVILFGMGQEEDIKRINRINLSFFKKADL